MDGVLRAISLSTLKTCEIIGNYEPISLYRDTEGAPLLNPSMFATKDDTIFVITNCHSESSADKKKEWIHHFYGDKINFLWVSLAVNDWGSAYVDPVAEGKLELIYKHDIDVYFDDDPAIIRVMRKINEYDLEMGKTKKHVVFIKYGPWIEEYYD